MTNATNPQVGTISNIETMRDSINDGLCDFSVSPYETAQYLRNIDKESQDAPKQISYILKVQDKEGYWGRKPFEVIPTLACVAALLERWGQLEGASRQHVTIAMNYIVNNVNNCRTRPLPDTVASETILPHLRQSIVEALLSMGEDNISRTWKDLHFEGANIERYQIRRDSIRGVKGATGKDLHTIEIFSPLAPSLADSIPLNDGCVACSPAATAAVLRASENESRMNDMNAYLSKILLKHSMGGISMGSNMGHFEFLWTLNFALRGPEEGLALPDDIVRYLQDLIGNQGVGGGPGLPPDGDDTSFAMLALGVLGRPVDKVVIDRYWNGSYFNTYRNENSASITTNAHALEYLSRFSLQSAGVDGLAQEQVLRTSSWLMQQMHSDGYWTDKWNASPFYATSEVILALAQVATLDLQEGVESALSLAMNWILENELPDLGWGWFGEVTEEEVSYVLFALRALICSRLVLEGRRHELEQAYMRACRYLLRVEPRREGHVPLWMGKDLYCPDRVVRTVISSARNWALLSSEPSTVSCIS